jgi:hypothetical protein
MKNVFGNNLARLVGIAVLSAPAYAHHGDAGRFSEETQTLSGTVIAVQLVNPHASVLFEVEGTDGSKVTWQAELGSPIQLANNFGWTRTTLQAGTHITVTGRPLKSGSPYINLTERARIVLTDTCKEIYHSTTLPDVPMSCAANGS